MDQATQALCASLARKTFELVKSDGAIPTNEVQYSYEEVIELLARQREIIAERIERGR